MLHGGEQSCEARVRVNAGGTVFETTRATLAGFFKDVISHQVSYRYFPIRSARLLPEKTVVARRARAFPGCLSKGGIECFLAFNNDAPVRLLRCSYVSCAAVRVRSPQVRLLRSARVRER